MLHSIHGPGGIALLLAAALAACQTAPVGRIVTSPDAEPSDPPLNPSPRHVVRLHGRAPETLDFRFRIAFLSTNREGDCWNHAGFWEGGGEKAWAYDLYPVRKGGHWEADLVVDRYLPGHCGWSISAGAVIFVEPHDGTEDDVFLGGMRSVIGDARKWDETAPQCKPYMRNCDEARRARAQNADEHIPVQVRCKRIPPEERIGDFDFICNKFADYKTLHYVKDHTRRIRIDLYDLDRETPPGTTVEEDAP